MARLSKTPFRIPAFKVQQLVVTCSQTVDWSLKAFGIPDLWSKTTGKGIKVAVLDTGCAMLHPDLVDQIADAADFTGSKVGPNDVNGHGTHCCGLIAAKHNDVGVVGVAYDAKLLVGKVLNDSGAGSAASIVKGIEWAVSKKADILSMSFGSGFSDPGIKKAIEYAASKNVMLIAAAGNEGPGPMTVGYPARYPQTVSVAAIDPGKRAARFSSRGPEVDIAAPGVDILSTYPPRNYAKLSGTSMATPFVAGVVALVLAYDKKLGVARIKNYTDLLKLIKGTSVDSGIAGFDNDYGWGLINPSGMLSSRTLAAKKKANKTDSNIVELTITENGLSEKDKAKFKGLFGELKGITFTFEAEKSSKGKKS